MRRTTLFAVWFKVILLGAAVSNIHCNGGSVFENALEHLIAELGVAQPLVASATYPRMMARRDGSLLATATHIDTLHHLQVLRSSDDGQTWSPLGEIAAGPGDLDNAFTLELDTVAPGATQRRLLAAFRNHDWTSPKNYTRFRITVSRSDDGGATWQPHSEVANTPPPWGIWEPFLRNGPDGSVEVYYAKEYAADDQDIVMQRSSDGGVTWGPLQTVAGANIVSRDGMPGVATYEHAGETSEVCIFESVKDNHFQIITVQSDDAGKTWDNRRSLHDPMPGHNSGAPQIVALPDRTLVASYMSDENSAVTAWPDHAAIHLQLAAPNDAPLPLWAAPVKASPTPSSWAGLLSRGPRQFWLAYEHGDSVLCPVTLKLVN